MKQIVIMYSNQNCMCVFKKVLSISKGVVNKQCNNTVLKLFNYKLNYINT